MAVATRMPRTPESRMAAKVIFCGRSARPHDEAAITQGMGFNRCARSFVKRHNTASLSGR